MQRLASEIIGSKLFTVHTGGPIGIVTGLLVRRKDLKVELFKIKLFEDNSIRYLLTSDIRTYEAGKIIINSYQELSEPDELLRHQELIKEEFVLFSVKVETQSGKRIGKIKDYGIDTAHYFATKLHIRAGFLQRIMHERLIIDRSDILDITKSKIVVRDATIKAKASNAKVLPA